MEDHYVYQDTGVLCEFRGFKQSALYGYSFSVHLLQATASLTLPSQTHHRAHHTTHSLRSHAPHTTPQTAQTHTPPIPRPHIPPHSLPPLSSLAANGSPRSRRASLPAHPPHHLNSSRAHAPSFLTAFGRPLPFRFPRGRRLRVSAASRLPPFPARSGPAQRSAARPGPGMRDTAGWRWRRRSRWWGRWGPTRCICASCWPCSSR